MPFKSAYCTKKLLYSEPAANRRICSARALAKFPELRCLLMEGELSLTTLSLVSRQLNDENKDQILVISWLSCPFSCPSRNCILLLYYQVVTTRERSTLHPKKSSPSPPRAASWHSAAAESARRSNA